MDNIVNIDFFRNELKKKKLKQKKLGECIGQSPAVISEILNGKTRTLRSDEVAKIAKELDVPVIFALAAATDSVDLEKEIANEVETVHFAMSMADELIEKSGKVLSSDKYKKLVGIIYKMERKNQAKGNVGSIITENLELILSAV